MQKYVTDPKDCFGLALMDHHLGAVGHPLLLHSSYGPPEEIPLDGYFYSTDELSEMDLFALSMCRGRVLDIGAAAGRHALALTEMDLQVTAMDISGYCCGVMAARGVQDPLQCDVFRCNEGNFDTAVLLTNGIGLAGNLDGYVRLLSILRHLVEPGGRIIFDSTDISYLYEGKIPFHEQYYGVVNFHYSYKGILGNAFDWIYLDHDTARHHAESNGWYFEVVYTDDKDGYLALLINTA